MTNQNNELDRAIKLMERAVTLRSPALREVEMTRAKQAIQALYAPTDRTFVEPRNSAPKPVEMTEYVKLMYPNDSFVTIEGDPEIIKQVLNRLDGQQIEFTKIRSNHDQSE